MKGIFHAGPSIEPLFQIYRTRRRDMSVKAAGGRGGSRRNRTGCWPTHTLVIDHGEGYEGRKNAPGARVGDIVDDILELGRHTDGTELDGR